MSLDQVVSIGRETLGITLLVAMPGLAVSVAVGLLVSVFQATTQIHDQTLSFVPKIIAVLATVMLFGGWMLRTLMDFTLRLIERLPGLI